MFRRDLERDIKRGLRICCLWVLCVLTSACGLFSGLAPSDPSIATISDPKIAEPVPDPLLSTLPDECRDVVATKPKIIKPSGDPQESSQARTQAPPVITHQPNHHPSIDHSSNHHRGVFWWSIKQHPYRISRVLRSRALRRSLIKRLKEHQVDRVYTFAQPFLRGGSAYRLRRWHRALHRANIKPHLLVGSPVWACQAPELFKLLRTLFARFQARSRASEHFAGVYLDIEPHALQGRDARCLYQWTQLSASQKRGLLYGLLRVVIGTRQLLDQLKRPEKPEMSLSVYLPVWLDNLQTPDSVWDSAPQRDQFYRCLGHFASEVTVAAYCRRGEKRLTESLRGERRLLGQKMRVGLNVYHRRGEQEACQTWDHLDEVWQTTRDLQRWVRPQLDVDLENLTRLLDQL